MKYGQMAGNEAINAMIYRCFEHIREEDARKFVKKFREQPPDGDQIMHTFRELVLGGYLSSHDFEVRHDYPIGAKTPDWCILSQTGTVRCLVELTNFHIDKATENEIEAQLQASGIAWVWLPEKDDRLYRCIWGKVGVYKALVQEHKVPYVIAVFSEFKAPVDWEEELYPSLVNEESGLFRLYPEISGVLHFEETSRGFLFNYVDNPDSPRRISLPSGLF